MTKIQISKPPVMMNQIHDAFVLVIEIWNLFVIWCLEFEI